MLRKPTMMRQNDQKAIPKTQKRSLLHYHEIPSWQQENEYLLSGYRPTAESTYQCVTSCLWFHNETVNILSHVVASILFAHLPWHFYYNSFATITGTRPVDLIVFTIYFWGVSACFACSVFCHVTWNHSPSVAALGNSMDYVGIVVLMWGASIPSIYYGFICDSGLRNFYWDLTSMIALGCIVVTMKPQFRTPAYRTYRAIMYTALGCSSLFFITHGILVHGFDIQAKRMALRWMLIMAVFNLFGAAAYASRCPERLYPYKFDFFGASHQIFHAMVILAGLAHYVGLVQALREVREIAPSCS